MSTSFDTPIPPAFNNPPPDRPAPGHRPGLLTGLAVLLVAVLVGGWFVATRVFGREDLNVTTSAATAGATSVHIDGSNADVTVEPSPDSAVHVHATGQFAGTAPDIRARTADGVTTVTLHCGSGWLNWCDINATVQLPADLALRMNTDNGSLTATGITGNLDLTSDNGDLDIRGGGSTITAVTDNGHVWIRDSTASSVTLRSNNGGVEAEMRTVPKSMDVQTDNGDVDLTVPGSAKYDVKSNTDNGTVKIQVGLDSDSGSHIVVATDNGDITVRTST